MIDPRILSIEEHYDQGSLDGAEFDSWLPFRRALEAFYESRWEEVYPLCTRSFDAASSPSQKAFVLQWAVAASEVQFDLVMRSRWLRRWNEIPEWAIDPYCRYLRAFHDGLSAFFDISLREAEERFKHAHELATAARYGRGQMRSLFHLGLVRRDRGDREGALDFLKKARRLAVQRRAERFIRRIDSNLADLGVLGAAGTKLPAPAKPAVSPSSSSSSWGSVDPILRKIEAALAQRDFASARALVAEAERARRSVGLKRRSRSVYIYLPLIASGLGKDRLARRLLQRISDPILKIRVLQIKKGALSLTEPEHRELQALQEMHGLSSVVVRASLGEEHLEVCGVALASLRSADVRALMKLLLKSSEAVTKESICRDLWNLSYDPTIHDGRIYKLIHQARSAFKRTDLFVNTYGGYRLNPAYLGRERAHG